MARQTSDGPREGANGCAIGSSTTGDGPKYISHALLNWAESYGIALAHIQSDQPRQNAYVEHYNRTVRHEWLHLYIFKTIKEVQQLGIVAEFGVEAGLPLAPFKLRPRARSRQCRVR